MPSPSPKRYACLLAAAQFVAEERENAAANVAFHLNHMLAHLRAARDYNFTHGLALHLPEQEPLLDLIGACVRLSAEQANLKASVAKGNHENNN